MSYNKDHAGALKDLQKAGLAVTFTRTVQNIDPVTETSSPPTITIVGGFAIRVKGDQRKYENMKLTDKEPLTLLFAASHYGDNVALDSVAVVNGKKYTVRGTDPVAPDGVVLISRVILST